MTLEQKELFAKALAWIPKEHYSLDLVINSQLTLENFAVYPEVLPPEKFVSLIFAQCLYFLNGFYRGKKVIDMGCGTGLQGIIAALGGAKSVRFLDNNPAAIANTQENLQRFALRIGSCKTRVTKSDLFSALGSTDDNVDVILFNHPFFAVENLPTDIGIGVSNIAAPLPLLEKFLGHAWHHMYDQGHRRGTSSIFMPYYHPAGEGNDPAIRFRESELFDTYGLRRICSQSVVTPAQTGDFSVYRFRKYSHSEVAKKVWYS